MKRLVSTVAALLLLMTGVIASSANDKIKAPVVKNLEGLTEKLIELESNELSTIGDVKDYIKQVEDLAEIYHYATNGKSKKQKALDVLNDVEKYADEVKANGSTRDMMECGILHTAAYHYKTALNCEKMQAQIILPVVDAMRNEIVAWLKLENTLTNYYAYSSYLFNQGGSMAGLSATGSAWSLAEARCNDTEQLTKAKVASSAKRTPLDNKIKEKANELVLSFTSSAKDLINSDNDFKDSPYYNEVSKGLTEACENLKTDMEVWINARLGVIACYEEQSQIPVISETFKLIDKIKKIGEQEN